ncbi:MAG: 50S ribosomal protein L32 [Deltaproteobacteria bacterium]|nr:50S ribosomal protein L32 [Deltaproteobacteria bacterium]
MAVPKKRQSRTRTATRRAQWDVIQAPTLTLCANPACRAPVRPHRVCGACGMYRGKQVLAVAAPAGDASTAAE